MTNSVNKSDVLFCDNIKTATAVSAPQQVIHSVGYSASSEQEAKLTQDLVDAQKLSSPTNHSIRNEQIRWYKFSERKPRDKQFIVAFMPSTEVTQTARIYFEVFDSKHEGYVYEYPDGWAEVPFLPNMTLREIREYSRRLVESKKSMPVYLPELYASLKTFIHNYMTTDQTNFGFLSDLQED